MKHVVDAVRGILLQFPDPSSESAFYLCKRRCRKAIEAYTGKPTRANPVPYFFAIHGPKTALLDVGDGLVDVMASG